jgi:UDP-N-acetylglucosamine 4-epimerase
VIPRWIRAFIRGESPVIYGDGMTSRDFCPVGNAVQANLLAAASGGGEPAAGVVNVSLGGETTLDALCAKLRDAATRRGIPCAHVQPTYEPFRAGDIRHSRADISAIREQFGYDPEVSLDEGLDATVAAFVESYETHGDRSTSSL